MSKDKKDKPMDQLLEHDADGIQEYDNDLPRWWVYLFYFTIIWSGVYIVYFHFSGIKTPREQLDIELAQAQSAAPVATGSDAKVDWAAVLADSKVLNSGKQIYMGKCLACHAPEGQGLVGPNLTDNFWIHGGSPEKILHTIAEGVPDKGMLTWKNILKKDELIAVSAFVIKLKGTHPPNPKAPQGEPEK